MSSNSIAIMTCNGCGLEESYSPTINIEEMKEHTVQALMAVKKYFEDQGWFIAIGLDLCPNCKEKDEHKRDIEQARSYNR